MYIRLRVGTLMRERGMTVPQLAEQAGIAINTARSLYRGVNERVDFVVLERVAKALGVRPLELFEEVEGERGHGLPELLAAF